jgi:dCMP deaminase
MITGKICGQIIIMVNYKFTKFDYTHMQNAYNWAACSHAKRKKVGAVIARENRCISHGFNGKHVSQSNICEENGKTRSDVIHAELNSILFAAKHGISTDNTTMYITCLPCSNCVPMIASAGIIKIIYHELYESKSMGSNLDLIESYGIEVLQIDGDYK